MTLNHLPLPQAVRLLLRHRVENAQLYELEACQSLLGSNFNTCNCMVPDLYASMYQYLSNPGRCVPCGGHAAVTVFRVLDPHPEQGVKSLWSLDF